MNQNPEQSGFFEESGRVKCIKLRGIASEGFIMPINSLISYINDNVSFDYPMTQLMMNYLFGNMLLKLIFLIQN